MRENVKWNEMIVNDNQQASIIAHAPPGSRPSFSVMTHECMRE